MNRLNATRLGIITYEVPHQKTQDLVGTLMLQGYKNLHLFALPFKPRPPRKVKFIHRFNDPLPIGPEELANRNGFEFSKSAAEDLPARFEKVDLDFILIAGAGLLPESLASNFKIINSHPGYLPKVKGLDALKWAILNDVEEIGVTTHFISPAADEGILIERRIIPLYNEDSFHSFALRQYRTEIEMLAKAIDLAENLTEQVSLADDQFEAKMRMPIRLEGEMMEKFETRRQNAKSIWDL